ncbi:MAG: histidine kinase [Cytophagales bacterium]|nr:histidine kinase [Cytophagales bacterium]
MKIEKEERKFHLLGWIIWIGILTLNVRFRGPSITLYILSPILYYAIFIVYFYSISFYILPRYWKVNYFKLIASFLLLMVAFFGYRYFTVYHLLYWIDADFQKPPWTIQQYLSAQLLYYSEITFLAIGYFVFKQSIQSIKQRAQLEKSLIRAEASFLLTQFNPHFLFNVLSYMYSRASRVSDELSQAIELLSEIMRYSLKKTNPGERVLLSDEIDHIENFIELNRMRFDNEIYVNFQVEGDIFGKKIIPLILISLVENVFKHGKINDPDHPANFKLILDHKSIIFKLSNHKKNNSHEPGIVSHGIGNENVRKRLALAYGDDFEQIIEEDETMYHYTLSIKEKSYAMSYN